MTLVYAVLAWTLGIVLARPLGPSPQVLAGLGAVTSLGLLLSLRRHASPLLSVLALAALLGAGRYQLSQPAIDAGHLAHYNDSGWLTVQGHISAEPSVRDTYTQLQITAERLDDGESRRDVRGKLVASIPHYPAYEYGDRLRISGLLQTPPVLDDFDYRDYLAARGVHSLMYRPQVALEAGTRGSGLLRQTYRIKRRLREVIEGILPNPDAGLLSGILLGLSHTLPDNLYEDFRATGLLHIIVISGWNISLVLQAVMVSSGRWLHRWLSLWACLALVLLYTLFVGPSPPVVRAALMGVLFVVGQLIGRRTHAPTSLAAASLFMTAWNPLLLWSVSYQLSFAATLGLIVIEPLISRDVHTATASRSDRGPRGEGIRGIRDLLVATVAAQIATLPLLWSHFGQVSIISPLANLLVLPAQPAIMALGAAATAVGALSPSLGRAAGWAVWPFTRYSIVIVQRLARLPWAAIRVPEGLGTFVWAMYATIAIVLVVARKHRPRLSVPGTVSRPLAGRAALIVSALAAVLIWSAGYSLPDQRLHIYFLDVGEGDAILLRTPGGRVVLVDGGHDPLTLTSHLGQILPFWQRRIDLVIATHADHDHLAGLIPVVERYRVGRALEPPSMGESSLVTRWHRALAEGGTPLGSAYRDMRIDVGPKVHLEVLHPLKEGTASAEQDDNANSIVLRLVYGSCRVLLTADIEAATEARLLARGDVGPVTVLKVAHHGSGSSTSGPFLVAADPQIAVISVGEDNRFGHPDEEVLARLGSSRAAIYRTDLHGTVECITNGSEYWVKLHRRRVR